MVTPGCEDNKRGCYGGQDRCAAASGAHVAGAAQRAEESAAEGARAAVAQ